MRVDEKKDKKAEIKNESIHLEMESADMGESGDLDFSTDLNQQQETARMRTTLAAGNFYVLDAIFRRIKGVE
jgi:hypothetical protein